MIIRSFSENDFLAVQNIYQQGIDTGNATFQTEAKSWQQWNSSMLNYCRLVAVEDEKVLGWAGLSAVSSREVYSGVAEVSVYVANQAQGKGLGQALLNALINESKKAVYGCYKPVYSLKILIVLLYMLAMVLGRLETERN